MPYPKNPDAVAWETVFLPLAGGVDLRTPARAVAPQRLLKLENGRFDSADAGLRKRRGHVSRVIRNTSSLAGAVDGLSPPALQAGGTVASGHEDNWVFGNGLTNGTLTSSTVSPSLGRCYGVASRDSETLVWDGWQLVSKPSGISAGQGFGTPMPAVIPTAVTTPLAKAATGQSWADLGVGDGIACVAWLDPVSDRCIVSLYDPVTWAPYMTEQTMALTSVVGVRVIAMGQWVHVFASSATSLRRYSFHRSAPWTVQASTVGDCATYFDVRKLNDNLFIVACRSNTDTATVYQYNASGEEVDTFFAGGTTLPTTITVLGSVAIAVHPQTSNICLVWYNLTGGINHRVIAQIYTSSGAVLGTETVLADSQEGNPHLTVEAWYLQKDAVSMDGYFQIYYEADFTVPTVTTGYFGLGGWTSMVTLKYAQLASHAWRVGNEVFVTLRSSQYQSPLQQSYFLCDTDLKPVGRVEYGTAQDKDSRPDWLPSVHFNDGQSAVNRTEFHGAIVYRTRVDSEDNDQYDEDSVKLMRLNFLPKLRSAQFGRATYFAGAMLGCYDGQQYSESGPLMYPEGVTFASHADAGNPVGTEYTYVVRWAWKNAQGEEQVSPGVFVTAATTTLRKVTVTIPTLSFTRRSGVYALVYRNEFTGTQWYLVSSRDPEDAGAENGYVANSTATTLTFVDNLSDADLLAREKNPGDAGLLEPFAPQGCEVIAAGKDRLWLAGGEIAPGYILPSLTYFQGKGVSFNGFLSTAVDRGHEPVTAFAFMGNSTFVFKGKSCYAFEAAGPSNAGAGSFDTPRVVLADAGAVAQEGVLLCTRGVLFPSTAGIKLLATNYQLIDVGEPVRDAVIDSVVSSGILIAQDQEVRFYCANGAALVWNYGNGEWSTWPGLECQGAVLGHSGLAVLGRLNGYTWEESEDTWTDGGFGYEFKWQTAWLKSSGNQSFQRVRRVAVLGDLLGAHELRCNAYYDDRDYPQDTWTWDVASDLNSATWGDTTWGAGLWGDTAADIGGVGVTPLQDGVYAHRHRLAKQKCSRVSVSFSDMGAPTEGPAFTEIAFEIGQRGGLSRLAPQTTS